MELSALTNIPVTNFYKTPDTLGKDRLAGIVAAHSLYVKENVLVIDAGTCITYDLITTKGEYYGGSISPGLNMRFKALHTFTEKLPLVSLLNFEELIGTDTNTSILSGVINGLIAETDAIIERYKELYSALKIIICGGDAQFLVDRLKNSIFAVPELVLIGLNEILDYNEL
jgi:type III pantothenate kinase